MMYDLILLVTFILFVGFFLYKNKKSVKKEGLLLLYKTSWGIKLINKIGKKYKKTLRILSYVSVTIGYLLMLSVLYLIGRIVWIYVFHKEIVQAIKIPPIMPLIPYLPQMFELNFLPPFYFTYWIIIIAVIAITHEIAHGIFAAKNKIKIRTTGFGFFPFFLPIFLAAFVEPDEKQMSKSSIFNQMTILSAGTFANFLTSIFFFVILAVFFSLAFLPAGVIYNGYAYQPVEISSITEVNGISLTSPNYTEVLQSINENTALQEIKTKDNEFVGIKAVSQDNSIAYMYYDSPAINSNLESIILKINGKGIKNREDFSNEFYKYSPGEKVTLTLIGKDSEPYNRDITLGEHPQIENRPFLGIQFVKQEQSDVIGKISNSLSFRNPNTYYEPKFDGVCIFLYHLLWWIVLISISVALINMLPVGIFDGGRFFYLTILAITKSENKAKKFFSFSTYFFLFLLLVVMGFWIFSFV